MLKSQLSLPSNLMSAATVDAKKMQKMQTMRQYVNEAASMVNCQIVRFKRIASHSETDVLNILIKTPSFGDKFCAYVSW